VEEQVVLRFGLEALEELVDGRPAADVGHADQATPGNVLAVTDIEHGHGFQELGRHGRPGMGEPPVSHLEVLLFLDEGHDLAHELMRSRGEYVVAEFDSHLT
jgi:hypothetical protein